MPFLGTFWKTLTKKIAFFFGARSPFKLVYAVAKGDFREFLKLVNHTSNDSHPPPPPPPPPP